MAKQVKKVTETKAPTKSRRPILKGKNTVKDLPKVFRHLKGFCKGLIGKKTKRYISESIDKSSEE